MTQTIHRFAALLLGLLAMAALAATARAEEHGHHAGIMAMEAWVRAVPPASSMSAAYMVLHNSGADADRLVAAASSLAANVELHNVREKDGMMEMYRVDGIEVPAHGQAELKPGGYHIMLIGLNAHPQPGEEVELTLTFEHAGELTLKVPVKEGGMRPMHHDHGQIMHH